MAESQTLIDFDAKLRGRLLAMQDGDLARAEKVPLSGRKRSEIEAWTPAARLHSLTLLEALDRAEAVRWADEFLSLPEVKKATWGSPLVERVQAAGSVLLAGLTTLSLEALVDAIVGNRLGADWAVVWKDEKFAFLRAHAELGTPAGAFAALVRTTDVIGWNQEKKSVDQHRSGWGFAIWLMRSLALEGHPPGASWMVDAWREHRAKAWQIDLMLGEAVCATGDARATAIVAETLDSEKPSQAAIVATFFLDPRNAYDKLAPLLDATEDTPKRTKALRLLEAIGQDGPSGGGMRGWLAKTRQNWVAADERWVPLLLSKRSLPGIDSYIVKRALEAVPPELLAKYKKAPAGKKKTPEARLERLGDVAYVAFRQRSTSAWVGGGRLVVATGEHTLAVHEVSAGLPLLAELRLPDNLCMVTAPRDPGDIDFDRIGVHAIAIHPRGHVLALAGMTPKHERVVVVVDALRGSVIARAGGLEEDINVHSLHWGASGETLWVGYLGEGDDAAANVIAALDAERLDVLGTCSIGDFPAPFTVVAHTHPKEDVGLFQVLAGQDGMWLKCIERGPKKLVVRKQKLNGNTGGNPVIGFSTDGSVAATLSEEKLLVRAWPDMGVKKTKLLGGTACSGAVAGDLVAIAVATVTNAPDVLQLYSLPTGDRVAECAWDAGETFCETFGDALLTTHEAKGRVSLVRVGVPSRTRG